MSAAIRDSLPMTGPGAQGVVRNMLFLCTHNSARSILAEAILNGSGDPRLRAYSAGSAPSGRVNPYAIEALILLGYDVRGLRSKSWREFLEPGAPVLDRVVTVCDSAAAEVCPAWPGGPEVVHWGLEDPSVAGTTDAERLGAFLATAHEIEGRLSRMLPGLPPLRDSPGALDR